jgi:hypothetical protein
MTHTRDDVEAAAKAAFPDDDLAVILALVDQYGTAPHEREKERVQVAMVELSEGSREKLMDMVKAARTDYRDVLAWKQLGPLPKADGEKLQKVARALVEKWGKE